MKQLYINVSKLIMIVSIVFFAIFILVGSTSIDNNFDENNFQNRFRYDGEYGLFIEYNKGLSFNWFTQSKVQGSYELLKTDGTSIVKGATEEGKVHKFDSNIELNEQLIFKYGGENETMYQVVLKPMITNEKSIFSNVDSLFVIGDVHGRYNELINLLKKSNIVNQDLEWNAGSSHLVFLGDLFDRGLDVTKVLWFIHSLEDQAKLAGGKVHLVLGNHEIMTMTKDLRYVSPKEMAIAQAFDKKYDELFHPLNSYLGKWLASKSSVIKIDKAIFAHGGILDLETGSIKGFNQLIHNYMNEPMFLDIMADAADSTKYDPVKWDQIRYFFYSSESPFWYRGYVQSDTLAPQLNAMLRKYKSNVHVVAHTPLETITQKYKGKLLTTDLRDAATQLLLLVKNKKKYERFKIDSSGNLEELK